MSTELVMPTREQIEEALRDVNDPELGVNIVDLGLVYDARPEQTDGGILITLDMTLTSAACPLTDVIEVQADVALTAGATALANEVRINWVWVPAWGPEQITDSGREQLRALGFNV